MNRSTYYDNIKEKQDKYASERVRIKQIYDKNKGRYGYRRITVELRKEGFSLNHKTVKRIMDQLEIKSLVRAKKYNSYKGDAGESTENIIKRDFSTNNYNEKWVTDVTEFKTCGQKIYLSALMDLHNREIISYIISERPTLKMVLDTIGNAISKFEDLEGLIIHSDQGMQYRTGKYRDILSTNKIVQSMSRKGNCLDNSVIENFFGLLKTEWYYLTKYNSPELFKKGLEEYIYYYNNERIKCGLNGLSPVEFRLKLSA